MQYFIFGLQLLKKLNHSLNMVSIDFVEFTFETVNQLIVYCSHLIRMVSKSLLDKLLLLSVESLALLFGN